MVQTLGIPAPTLAAVNSSDIIVDATPVTLLAYTADGLFPSDVQIFVERKCGANWQLEGMLKGYSILVNAPGTYRLRKGATPYAIGFGIDEITFGGGEG